MTIIYDGVNSIIRSVGIENPKGKTFPEDESRKRLINIATQMGCVVELKMIFDRYDRLMRNCSNPVESKHISILGIAEINKLMGFKGNCEAGGVEIGTPEDPAGSSK
jgi:hypothetical protein